MADNLRTKIIRLAHQNPELRPHLLSVLKEAAEDDNPYGLYEGHEQVTERIADEIASTAVTVASAYKSIEKLIAQNAKYGTTDSDSREAIWSDWEDSMKKAIRGKT